MLHFASFFSLEWFRVGTWLAFTCRPMVSYSCFSPCSQEFRRNCSTTAVSVPYSGTFSPTGGSYISNGAGSSFTNLTPSTIQGTQHHLGEFTSLFFVSCVPQGFGCNSGMRLFIDFVNQFLLIAKKRKCEATLSDAFPQYMHVCFLCTSTCVCLPACVRIFPPLIVGV